MKKRDRNSCRGKKSWEGQVVFKDEKHLPKKGKVDELMRTKKKPQMS